MYRKSLSYLKILVCAAFMMVTVSAVSPSADALVTESSGDGMALYNGVMLPNIDSVWTDRETYPYAYLFDVRGDSLNSLLNTYGFSSLVGTVDVSYFVHFSNKPYTWNGSRFANAETDGATLAYSFLPSVFEDWTFAESWTYSGNNSSYGKPVSTDCTYIWCNTDLVNSNGTVYLAASDPVPLDGVNLIAWDGDTSGLQSFDNFYGVSPYFLPDQAFAVLKIIDEYEFCTDIIFSDSGWKINSSDVGTVVFGLNGSGVGFYQSPSEPSVYTTLLAYTSSGGGGDTPIDPDPDPDPGIDFSGTTLTSRLYDLDFQSAVYKVDWFGLPVDVPSNTFYFLRGYLSDGRVASPAETYIPWEVDSLVPVDFTFSNLEPSTSYTATFDLVYNTTGHFYGFTETGVSTEVTFTTAADTGVTDGDKAIINAIENTNKEHESWLDNQMGSAVGDLNEDVAAADQQIDDLNNQEQAYMDDAFSRFQEVSASFSGFDGTVGSGIGLAGTLFSRFFNCLGDYAIIYTFPLILGLAMVIIGRLSRSSFSIEGKDSDKGGE